MGLILDIERKFFTVRVMWHWTRFSSEAGMLHPWKCLDFDQSGLVWKVSLPMAERLELDDL